MKILGSKAGGNPVRVAFFLAEKNIDAEFVPVDLMNGEHRTPAFLAKNPFGEVPVLELDDGTCISETLAICRYLERHHPDPNLMGLDPLEEANIEMWQRRMEFNLYLPARAVLRHSTPGIRALEPVQISAWAELNRPRVREALERVDHRLSESRFLAGDRYTIADITLLFCALMAERIQQPLTEAGENLQRWYDEVRQRPAVVRVLTEMAG